MNEFDHSESGNSILCIISSKSFTHSFWDFWKLDFLCLMISVVFSRWFVQVVIIMSGSEFYSIQNSNKLSKTNKRFVVGMIVDSSRSCSYIHVKNQIPQAQVRHTVGGQCTPEDLNILGSRIHLCQSKNSIGYVPEAISVNPKSNV